MKDRWWRIYSKRETQRQKNNGRGKRLHAVTKGFLKENQSQVTVKSLRRRWKWGGGRKRRKEKKELYILLYFTLQAIPSLTLFQTLAFIFHFYCARTPAEFEKFHSRKRADGMLREPWQVEKMRRDRRRSGGISQVENVCVCVLYVGENENYAMMKSDGLIISKRAVCVYVWALPFWPCLGTSRLIFWSSHCCLSGLVYPVANKTAIPTNTTPETGRKDTYI